MEIFDKALKIDESFYHESAALVKKAVYTKKFISSVVILVKI